MSACVALPLWPATLCSLLSEQCHISLILSPLARPVMAQAGAPEDGAEVPLRLADLWLTRPRPRLRALPCRSQPRGQAAPRWRRPPPSTEKLPAGTEPWPPAGGQFWLQADGRPEARIGLQTLRFLLETLSQGH